MVFFDMFVGIVFEVINVESFVKEFSNSELESKLFEFLLG